MADVAALWRHPIKSHGREVLERVVLTEGQTIPWDRHWAVTHDQTKFDPANPGWVGCRNFMIGTSFPRQAGIWAQLDEDAGRIELRHADLGNLSFCPDDPADADRFLTWIAPLAEDTSLRATGLATAGLRGMTDTPYPSVSLMSVASHDAVVERLGHPLESERWRGNIWMSGFAPWVERDWIGRDLRIGGAVLSVRDHIARCKHTMANPVTGQRDVDTLGALRAGWDHQDFGVYAVVTTGGPVAVGDPVEVI